VSRVRHFNWYTRSHVTSKCAILYGILMLQNFN